MPYWRISQFPELDHLEPSQRERLLRAVPWWTPIVLAGRGVGAGVVLTLPAAIAADAVFGSTTVVWVSVGVFVSSVIGVYFFQVHLIRKSVRRELFREYRKHRPPICLRCCYDLRGSAAANCPECGWKIPG